ncbi:MAG: GNAT family N-acetyltransferase [Alphaproteobacteria bacterium]|nr:GNAT family N-acetyltransferase [Alphaproteobacteria bacterium]
MTFTIIPIAENHIPGFHAAVDAVAHERKFLAFLEAPPLDQTTKFVLDNIALKNPQFVVLSGSGVVGWCDVIRNTSRRVYSHRGTLGIGLLPEYRGRGIGRLLMRTTIDAAWQCGMTRIDLTVRGHNANAIGLYKSLGFEMEGRQRNAVRVDGQYEDVFAMALVKK